MDSRKKTLDEILGFADIFDNLLIGLPTGYGKTYISMCLLDKYVKDSFVFFVPEIALIENSKNDFIKQGFSHLLRKGEFVCYASMKNYRDRYHDVYVFDEVHNAVSDLRVDVLKSLKCQKRIALSATISEEVREILNQICSWSEYSKTLRQAIDEGVLKEPTIHYIEIELDDTIKRQKLKYKSKEILGTDREYYDYLSTSITYWRERYQDTGEIFAKNRMVNLGSQRQKFLADCKEVHVKELLKEIGDKRFICFCGSVAQAKRIGKNVCSSHRSKKGNKELIDSFNNLEINNLFAVEMLKEGQNLNQTDIGILIQPGNQEKDFIQMLGRTLRSDNPHFYIFKAKDTVDTRFINNSTKQLK